MNNVLPFEPAGLSVSGVQEVCRTLERKIQGILKVVGGASITEASSGGDLGDSNTVIGRTRVGG